MARSKNGDCKATILYPTPTNILSLPEETLIQIALLLDRRAALSFALAHPAFTLPSTPRIWFNINLVRVADGTLVNACRDGLARKIASILAQGDNKRWTAVRTLLVPSSAQTPFDIPLILKSASNSLRSLDIRSPPWELYYSGSESWDLAILDGEMRFPSLLSLSMGAHTFGHLETVATICNAAPNLASLDLDLDHRLRLIPSTRSPTDFSDQINLTDLRVTLSQPLGPPDFGILLRILGIFSRCPRLQRLSVGYRFYMHNPYHERLMATIAGYEGLTDLYWAGLPEIFHHLESMAARGQGGFPRLRRIVASSTVRVEARCWYDVFFDIAALPALEVIYLSALAPVDPSISQLTDPQSFTRRAQRLIPSFAANLRGSPLLHTVRVCQNSEDDGELNSFQRLDQLEETYESAVAIFRSYHLADQDILHAQLLLQYVETGNIPRSAMDYYSQQAPDEDYIEYEGRDGSQRVKLYRLLPEPTWMDYTDFEGDVVPLEVLKKMQEVEGSTDEEWNARGIEVGDEAWAVLMRWRESVKGV